MKDPSPQNTHWPHVARTLQSDCLLLSGVLLDISITTVHIIFLSAQELIHSTADHTSQEGMKTRAMLTQYRYSVSAYGVQWGQWQRIQERSYQFSDTGMVAGRK